MIALLIDAALEGAGPWSEPRWIATTHIVRDGKDYSTRAHFSPPGPPRPDGTYSGNTVHLECEVHDLRTHKSVVHRGTGGSLMRQDIIGGQAGDLGSFSLWLPGFGGHKDGYLQFDDPRCASGVPTFGVDD